MYKRQLYGAEAKEGLLEATQRLQRRLGPQLTQEATESIRAVDLSSACAVILDYYDRCYDHELERSPQRRSVDISGLSIEQAADHLLAAGALAETV